MNVWPYPLTAYNCSLDGPTSAQRVHPVGWGEGSSNAALRAAALPGAEDLTLVSANLPATAPFSPGRLLLLNHENLAHARPRDFAIFDASNWRLDPGSFSADNDLGIPIPKSLTEWQILDKFHFNGLPRSVLLSAGDLKPLSVEPISEQTLDLTFDQNLELVTVTILPTASPSQVQVISELRLSHAEDYQLLLELIDESRHVRVSQELPLLNDVDHRAGYWPAAEIQRSNHDLQIPADLPPGHYRLTVSLFDHGGARQDVFDKTGLFRGIAANIAEFEVRAPEKQPPITIPTPLEGGVELAGSETPPERVGSGELLTIDLWWQDNAACPTDSRLALLLGDQVLLSSSDLPTGKLGQKYHIRLEWWIPANLAAGSYSLAIQLIEDDGTSNWGEPIYLGQIDIEDRHRLYELPPELEPLQILVGEIAHLQQATATLQKNMVLVNVIWQAKLPDGLNYVAFVHLMDSEQNMVSQVDQPPADPTGSWLPGQVIYNSFTLPAPEDGRYTIAMGLDDPASGKRWSVIQADGDSFATDSYQYELRIP